MTTRNWDIVCDKCVRSDRDDWATSDYRKHSAWKEHYQIFLNEEFEWKNENLSLNNPIIEPQLQIEKVSVRKTLHKVKKGKTSGTSGFVLLLSFGDVDTEWLKNLFDKIIAENKVPKDWTTSVIVNCFQFNSDATERGNYRGLKLLEHMMKVF